MTKYEHLTKDRELELGGIIQKHLASSKKLEAHQQKPTSKMSPKTVAALQEDVRLGKAAIEELVNANMGLVYDRARVFKLKFPSAPDMEDLVSMGAIGLMTAVQKYDPSRGNKFSTVAYYWIAQAIGREVNKTSRMVRLPENRIADYTRMNQVARKYDEDGIAGSTLDHKMMEELDLTKTEIVNIRNAAVGHTSLNRKVGNSSDGAPKELGDIVGEEQAVLGTESSVTTNECFRLLQNELDSLDPLKRKIIAAQFALPINENYSTPQEIRDEHALSSSKFRRLLSEGLEELKTNLSERDLNLIDFLEV